MKARSILSLLALLVSFPACGDLTDVSASVVRTAYTPDGQLVVFTSAGIKVYDGDLAAEKTSMRVEGERVNWEPGSASLSANGQVGSLTYGDGQTLVYDISRGERLVTIIPEPATSSLYGTLSPGGDLAFAYGGGVSVPMPPIDINGVIITTQDLPGVMYRTSDGSRLWAVQYPDPLPSDPYCIFGDLSNPPLFAPDGKTLYVPITGRLFSVDTATGVAQLLLNAHACISGMTFLADGSLLVHRGVAGSAITFHTTGLPPADEAQAESFAIYKLDGTLVRELAAFDGYISNGSIWSSGTPIACSLDGVTCALVTFQGTGETASNGPEWQGGVLLLWRLDGTLVYSMPWSGDFPALNLAFSPDGSRLAVATHAAARVYSVADGAMLAERKYTNGVF